ncbi:GNAT family N-acetyltransferase, partial [Candidatus Parcubacteria bacterium]|nr:GNAT family N-acetyltransferase [Candidatus Parcubacteria bacterium]
NKTKKWFKELQENPDKHHFSVYTKEKEYCGEVYYEIDRKHKRAGLDIKFRPEVQGKGFAADALKTLIDFVFKKESDVDAAWTEPSEKNIAAKKLYKRCGLKPKNRPKDMEQNNNSYWEIRKNN